MKPMTALFDEQKNATPRTADLGLTRAVATGDRVSQKRLLERVMPRVERSVRYLARGKPDADDLMQLALIQIIRSADSFRGESSLDFWVDRVVLQILTKHFEKRSRRKRLRESVWAMPSGVLAPADEQAERAEMGARLSHQLGELSDKLPVTVVLFCLHGYSASEIAVLTDTKVNTVRGRIRLGLKQLKKRMTADPVLRDWVGPSKR